MEMHSVESSNISSIGWDSQSGLRIIFTTGKTYEYPAVPFDLFSDFAQAESKGQFFAQNIKGKFESVKL